MSRHRRGKGSAWTGPVLRWAGLLAVVSAGLLYVTAMPGESYSGPWVPLAHGELGLRERLEGHIRVLAGEIGERNVWNPRQMEAAATYVKAVFEDEGYDVRAQAFMSHGVDVRNLEVELAGSSLPKEIILIGAHYDSVAGSPGANDNASGIAALLENARLLARTRPSRTVRFVAFANEEPPFFYTQQMGSRVYAARARGRGERIVAMLSLETIGYYSDEKGSQRYPFPFSMFYPDTGNFIGFVGNLSSRRLVRRAIAAFRDHTAFPSEGVAAPGWMTGVHWSDHWSFWEEGYPALMITDTALYRYRHYHSAADTPEKLDYRRLARVVGGIAQVVAELAGIHEAEGIAGTKLGGCPDGEEPPTGRD